jgi:hypothetical protein
MRFKLTARNSPPNRQLAVRHPRVVATIHSVRRSPRLASTYPPVRRWRIVTYKGQRYFVPIYYDP